MFGRLITHFTVLQQEGYQVGRFVNWLIRHQFRSKITAKKPLVWTQKVKNILFWGVTLWLIAIVIFYVYLGTPSLMLLPLSLWQPSVFLIIGLMAIRPYEIVNRMLVIAQARKFLANKADLKIVGITGSFGKTSVKDFLFEITRDASRVVKTPESYNTVFGIKKVLDFEITNKTKLFLCEMGAYKRGEIAELCRMVPPTHAILTAIGTQHLERFGSLENTTLGKFELVDAVDPAKALVNLDNHFIANRIQLGRYRGVRTYSINNPRADFFIKNRRLLGGLTRFELCYQKKTLMFCTKLFGSSNLSNLVGAIGMALMLKIPYKQIYERVLSLTPSPHRLELKKIGNAKFIDDAFSSNEQGFTNLISDIKQLAGKKVIVTPGIVELGHKTAEVHKKLGSLMAEAFDLVYLVHDSERTKAIIEGLGSKTPYVLVKNDDNIWEVINKLSKQFDWIVLENDLTDIY